MVHNITVRCEAAGDPQAKVTWMKKIGELPPGRSKVSVDGTLKIWNPVKEDSGIYIREASSNEVLKTSVPMKLIVK